MESKDEMIKSQIAIRCAKVAILLHALNSSSKRGIQQQAAEEEMIMMMTMARKEISELKIELAKERVRRKRIKLCGFLDYFLVHLFFLSLFLLISLFL